MASSYMRSSSIFLVPSPQDVVLSAAVLGGFIARQVYGVAGAEAAFVGVYRKVVVINGAADVACCVGCVVEVVVVVPHQSAKG